MKHISQIIKSDYKIIILDTWGQKVWIREIPSTMIQWDGDEIMSYFETVLPIHASDCNYMVVEKSKGQIDDNTKNNA